jgi:hypothetical protein
MVCEAVREDEQNDFIDGKAMAEAMTRPTLR